MDYDNFEGRLKSAMESVSSQVKGGTDFGLAISKAAAEYSIDKKFLAKKVRGGRHKKTSSRSLFPKPSSAWKEADERRYRWMDD